MYTEIPRPDIWGAGGTPEKPGNVTESGNDKDLSSFALISESRDRGRREFGELLRATNLRALVRYIEDGLGKLDQLPEIPDGWKKYFHFSGFRSSDYTWRNPKLYLLTKKSAAVFALEELLRRLSAS